MDDKTLVERLRNLADEWFEMCDDIHEPLNEAADTIEAQATRIEALEAALREICQPANVMNAIPIAQQALLADALEGEHP